MLSAKWEALGVRSSSVCAVVRDHPKHKTVQWSVKGEAAMSLEFDPSAIRAVLKTEDDHWVVEIEMATGGSWGHADNTWRSELAHLSGRSPRGHRRWSHTPKMRTLSGISR